MSCRSPLCRWRPWLFLLASLVVCSGHALDSKQVLGPVQICTDLLEKSGDVLVASIADEAADEAADEFDDGVSDGAPDDTSAEPVPLNQRVIYEICPEQVDVLVQHPRFSLLARAPQELMLLDLQGFYAFSEHYEKQSAFAVLDETKLDNILRDLNLPQPEPISLWQRILDWFKQWWQPDEEQDFDWLERFVPSETTLKIIMFVSIALVIILAIGIVVVEVRAGLVHRRRAYSARWAGEEMPSLPVLSFEEVQAAPLAEQPGLLLRWLLEQLIHSGLPGLRASLTHRDIAAVTASLAHGDSVAQISYAAERATFGDWEPNEQEMSELRALGKAVPSGMREPQT